MAPIGMTEFVQLEQCPPDFSPALRALWYAKRGDWHKAHQIVQDCSDRDSAWVHAYLHRQEGDLSNAYYWYRQAGQPQPQLDLAQEWEAISECLLKSR